MDILKINSWDESIPENYSGILDYGYCIEYYLNDKLHREDGPAVIYSDGTINYYLNGKLHREYGPAVIWNNGSFEYYINNNNITKKVNKWIKENNIPEDWTNSDKITF